MSELYIRPFALADSEQASGVIVRCLKEVNSRDYAPDQITRLCGEFTPDKVKERFGGRTSFVAVQNSVVVGTVTLKGDEVGSVFVRPDLHGKGIGELLMSRIEVEAGKNGTDVLRAYSSLAAVHFYLRLGYRQLREKRELDGEVTLEVKKQLLWTSRYKRGFRVRDIEISLPGHYEDNTVAQAIDAALVESGLRVTMRDTLRKYPDCIHWHAKNETKPGTLEVTFWPQQSRAWFTVQSGRNALWIEEKLVLVAANFQQKFQDID